MYFRIHLQIDIGRAPRWPLGYSVWMRKKKQRQKKRRRKEKR